MTRLLAAAMLGALVRWLRVLGVDTAYDPALDDPELVERALAEERTLLTRDRRLVERRALAGRHLLIDSEVVGEQLRQVIEAFGLTPAADDLFTRCLRCNAPLEPTDPETARRHVPPFVARTQERFRRCPTAAATTGAAPTPGACAAVWREWAWRWRATRPNEACEHRWQRTARGLKPRVRRRHA